VLVASLVTSGFGHFLLSGTGAGSFFGFRCDFWFPRFVLVLIWFPWFVVVRLLSFALKACFSQYIWARRSRARLISGPLWNVDGHLTADHEQSWKFKTAASRPNAMK